MRPLIAVIAVALLSTMADAANRVMRDRPPCACMYPNPRMGTSQVLGGTCATTNTCYVPCNADCPDSRRDFRDGILGHHFEEKKLESFAISYIHSLVWF
jgi:hypothetical protein